MKFSIAAAVFLSCASISAGSPLDCQFPITTAAATPTGPTASQVTDAIKLWKADIVNINDFLGTSVTSLASSSLKSVASAVSSTYVKDEPEQLKLLSTIPNLSTDGRIAVANLRTFYKAGVIDQIQAIAQDPAATAAKAGVSIMNNIRCHQLLQDVQALWQDAAKVVSGVTLPSSDLSVPRPSMCPSACKNL